MFDPDLYESPRNSHGMLGYKLLEGNEKGGLQCDRSIDGMPSDRQQSAHSYHTKKAPEGAHLPMQRDPRVERRRDGKKCPGEDIGYQGHGKKELSQLGGIPCPLKILSAIENRRSSDEQSHYVLLDQCSGEKDPGVEVDAWFDCEIRHAIDPLVISDGVVENG